MATVIQPCFEPPAGPPATGAAASITPPHSANGKADVPEGVPSELSDLELDPRTAAAPVATPIQDDIQPDHYYGGGKIPVFKPVSRVVPDLSNEHYRCLCEYLVLTRRIDNGSVSRFPVLHQSGGEIWHAIWDHQSHPAEGVVSAFLQNRSTGNMSSWLIRLCVGPMPFHLSMKR